jgi:hypothetical protein
MMERTKQGDHPVVAKIRRNLYDASHPTGQHTNGPVLVHVEASHLAWLVRFYDQTTGEQHGTTG